MDTYTFCERLGKVEGNRWMKAHWSNWYNEDYIKKLAERGVKRVRIPIGDWTVNQYSHYKGCMDGAADEIKKMLDICA